MLEQEGHFAPAIKRFFDLFAIKLYYVTVNSALIIPLSAN